MEEEGKEGGQSVSRVWFTADFHLFHDNIIRYCNRPFENIWDMHETIIEGMNAHVTKSDELFILGDVSFYGGEKVRKILEAINGRKHFIVGNHDAKNMGGWSGWESVSHYKEIKREKQNIVLCHYPLESWNKMSYGAIHLHGHRHGTRPPGQDKDECPWGFRVDVGVDPWGFKPVSLSMLTEKWLAEGKLV